MFAWLPIVGPIIDGIVSIFTKYQDTQLAKYTVDGQIDVAAMTAGNQLTLAAQTDIGVRLCRDLIMFPVGVWTAIISWDNIIRPTWPQLYLPVLPYPPVLEFLPYAVIAFLFGTTAMILWKR